MIVIAICAVICGAEGWTDIENFGNSKLPWLKSFLELPNGIPSHDTFGRVFSMLDAQQFQLAFYEWVMAVNAVVHGQIINIDGKRLAGSEDKFLGKRAIYMVSAWAEENEIVLGQRKVGEKSNEITAIPELLKILAISGCIVTIDAIGTQTTIAKTIVEAQADNVLSVKENQGHLFEDISVLFAVDQAQNFQYATLEDHQEVNKGHGHIEIRECWCTSDPAYLNLIRDRTNWTALQSVAMVVSTRIVAGKQTQKVRHYISSCPVTQSDCCISRADIGLLKMNCIGSWMWLSTKITVVYARIKLLKTSLSCATWLSTCSNRRKPPKAPSMPNNSKLLGRKRTYSKSSPLIFRCDCPTRQHNIGQSL